MDKTVVVDGYRMNIIDGGNIMVNMGKESEIDNLVVSETLDDRLAKLEKDNLILMDALATVYEELLTLKSGGVV